MANYGLRKLLVVGLFWMSCSSNDQSIQIQESLNFTAIKNQTSTFCMPIEISLNELEKKVNHKIKHHLLVDKEGDNHVIINVERAGRIQLVGVSNKVLITLPIKVTAQKKIKINLLTVDFKIDIHILSDVDISSDWSINSSSKIEKIVWKDNPEISVLGFNIDIKDIVEKEVNKKREDIARTVDEAIQDKVNLKKHLDRIWYKMQKPHNIIKQTGDKAFLFIEPKSVFYLSHSITPHHIQVNVKSEANFTLKSSYTEDSRTPLPILKKERSECHGFDISMLAELKFADINAKINKYLKDKSTTIKGYVITLKHAEVRASGQDLYIHLKVGGSVGGSLAGLVAVDIDTAKHKVSGSLKQFEVLEGDIGLELAGLILGSFVANELNSFGGFQYRDYVKEVPVFIIKGIEQGESGDKWHPVFNEMTTNIQNFEITNDGIHLLMQGTGTGRIVVDKLKMQ